MSRKAPQPDEGTFICSSCGQSHLESLRRRSLSAKGRKISVCLHCLVWKNLTLVDKQDLEGFEDGQIPAEV